MKAQRPLFIALVLLIPCIDFVAAQESDADAMLFIITQPYFARVELDGQRLDGRTPLLVRSVSPGYHEIVLTLEGFLDERIELNLAMGEAKVAEISMESESIDVLFPYRDAVSINRHIIDARDASISMEPGTYDLAKDEKSIVIEARFPQEHLLDALKIVTPTLFILSGILTVESLIDAPRSGRPAPMAVMTTQAANMALITVTAILNNQKKKYFRSYSVPVITRATSAAGDRALYETAEKQLNAGDMDKALANFQAITESESPSSYYPKALYQQSKIQNLLGERDAAIQGFQEIVSDYPLPELYDRSLKSLADLLLSREDYSQSLQYLDSMVFWDPFYSKEEIHLYRSDIAILRYQQGEGGISDVLDSCRQMVLRYPDSDSTSYYRYRYAFQLYTAGDLSGARAQIDHIDVTTLSDRLKKEVDDLSRKIEGAVE